jgi:hypothetical protein
VWDSAAFSSIFLASSFSCSRTESTPAHTQVTQTVGLPLAKFMNREEQITFEHLKKLYGEDVIPVPKHEDPPDILVNSTIAVEVRRLNQHFFESGESEGLENLSFPLESAFKEVLNLFDNLYAGQSYWVFIEYKRPFNFGFRKVKKEMELALQKFLDLRVSNFPHEISVNSEISFTLHESTISNGNLFRFAGSGDFDAGGGVIEVYAENIRHCIREKSYKISRVPKKYCAWWLYLVDCMGFGLSQKEISEVVKEVENTGSFDKVVVLDYDGANILATISK